MKALKPNDLVIIPTIEPKKETGSIKPKHFEEEVSGINLSKLFSVYGAQSIEKKISVGQQEDSSESEDEEPLIIQLMESMFTRKKTVLETE
jgi:hypothetical protein